MISIRWANLSDAEQILPFLEGLGYPMSLIQLQEKMGIYNDKSHYGLLIAEKDKRIVGFVAFSINDVFILPAPRVRIEALFVDPNCRKQNIGRLLIEAVEQEAKKRGCVILELTSGARRAVEGTHEFYRRLGFHNEGPDAKLYLRKQLSR
jgi:GNAT superfamily N-acetyltransferase